MPRAAMILILFMSLMLYLYDVGSDIALATAYKMYGDNLYFGLTLIFIIAPAIITNSVGYEMYSDEHEKKQRHKKAQPEQNQDEQTEKSPTVSYGIMALHFCLQGVVYRHCETIYHVCRVSSEQFESRRMVLAQLALLETFFEAAPQLVLQLYIVTSHDQVIREEYLTGDYMGISKENGTAWSNPDVDSIELRLSSASSILQIAAIVSSLISMSWNLTQITRHLRHDNSLPEMSWLAFAVYFFWRLFTIAPRVLAIALFAAAFSYWSGVVVLLHSLIVGIHLWWKSKAKFSSMGILANLLRGLYFTFSYFGDKKEPGKACYLIFFSFELAENIILVSLWALVVNPTGTIYFGIALTTCIASTVTGFLFMLIYLYRFHPEGLGVNTPKTINEMECYTPLSGIEKNF